MIESVSSVFSNIRDKFTNPFFGTLIGVWIVRNWVVVYAFFNFDEGFKLAQKIKFIEAYYAKKYFWYELWTNLWIAFLFTLGGLLIWLLTDTIKNLVVLRLRPYITKYTVSNSVIEKYKYDKVLMQRDSLGATLDDARSRAVDAETRASDAKLAETNAKIKITTLEDEISAAKHVIESLHEAKENFQSISKSLGEQYQDEVRTSLWYKKAFDYTAELFEQNISPAAFQRYLQMKDNDSTLTFFKYIVEIRMKKSLPVISELNQDFIRKLSDWGLIMITNESNNITFYDVEITDLGVTVYDNLDKFELIYTKMDIDVKTTLS